MLWATGAEAAGRAGWQNCSWLLVLMLMCTSTEVLLHLSVECGKIVTRGGFSSCGSCVRLMLGLDMKPHVEASE